MCFNLFAPLAQDLTLAGRVLAPLFDGLAAVHGISIEYTPDASILRDQSGQAGVDCDVLIDAEWSDRSRAVIAVETKFVERDFSICSFRKPERIRKGQAVCPPEVPVRGDRRGCLYHSRRGYAYWRQTDRLRTLREDALPEVGCPFGGPEWQLWVNHTLAHAVAELRGASQAFFVVCAPAGNESLLQGDVLDRFRARLSHPESFGFVSVESLVTRISEVAAEAGEHLKPWAQGLSERYSGI